MWCGAACFEASLMLTTDQSVAGQYEVIEISGNVGFRFHSLFLIAIFLLSKFFVAFCVVCLILEIFVCWWKGFCHCTESDIFLFLFIARETGSRRGWKVLFKHTNLIYLIYYTSYMHGFALYMKLDFVKSQYLYLYFWAGMILSVSKFLLSRKCIDYTLVHSNIHFI